MAALQAAEQENSQLHVRNGDLVLELANLQEQIETRSHIQPEAAIALLEEGLKLKANTGGAIKNKIREAIAILTSV